MRREIWRIRSSFETFPYKQTFYYSSLGLLNKLFKPWIIQSRLPAFVNYYLDFCASLRNQCTLFQYIILTATLTLTTSWSVISIITPSTVTSRLITCTLTVSWTSWPKKNIFKIISSFSFSLSVNIDWMEFSECSFILSSRWRQHTINDVEMRKK